MDERIKLLAKQLIDLSDELGILLSISCYSTNHAIIFIHDESGKESEEIENMSVHYC